MSFAPIEDWDTAWNGGTFELFHSFFRGLCRGGGDGVAAGHENVHRSVCPGARQAAEETLLQTSNLLAEWVAHDLREADIAAAGASTQHVFSAYAQRRFGAEFTVC